MAISKAVAALREEGYEIESVPHRGYRLLKAPDAMNQAEVLAALGAHPWREQVIVLPEVDSTNTYAKLLAQQGALSGTVVIADCQTGGRGRLGRSFASPAGCGVYLTVLLRPALTAAGLETLTVRSAVAMCDAVEAATGTRPGIKWTNDLVLGGKKLSGILTELSVEAESGMAEYVVIGIGVNVSQKPEDFPPEVRPMATSLTEALGQPVSRAVLAAEMIRALAGMARELARGDAAWLTRYRSDCVTLHKQVRVLRGGEERFAYADDVDESGALLVTWDDGTTGRVFSGEVSVRGMYGYL
jgi:BirA family biotin operon repressor/biotin-[acetyl-CoA-carboxylase] ligase